MNNRQFNQRRADSMRQQYAELMANGDDESLERAYDLKNEADEIEHYLSLDAQDEDASAQS